MSNHFWTEKRYTKLIVSILVGALFIALTVGTALWMRGPVVEEPIARTTYEYGWLRSEVMVVTGEGTYGTVTGTQISDAYIRGHLYGIYVDYHTPISTTTDLTLTQSYPPITILLSPDTYADTWYYPSMTRTTRFGAVSDFDQMVVNGRLTALVGDTISNVTNIVTVTIYWGG